MLRGAFKSGIEKALAALECGPSNHRDAGREFDFLQGRTTDERIFTDLPQSFVEIDIHQSRTAGEGPGSYGQESLREDN